MLAMASVADCGLSYSTNAYPLQDHITANTLTTHGLIDRLGFNGTFKLYRAFY